MSFFRHGEIYRPMDSRNVPGRPWHDRPRPHRFDEFPAGYSSAGCAPAEPASASPAEAHLAGIGSSSTIELQRTVNRLLTPCLTQGDNPISSLAILTTREVFMHFTRRTLVRVLILFGLYLVFTSDPVPADRASCEQIRTACKNAGFVLGGGALSTNQMFQNWTQC